MFSQRDTAAILCFSLLAAGNLTAFADAASDARKAIAANTATMTAALNKKDIKGVTQFYADDVVLIGPNGEQFDKKQLIEQFQLSMQAVKSIKMTRTIEKFALKNNVARTTVRETTDVVIPHPQTKKDIKMNVQSVEQFIWVRSGKNWKLRQIKTTTQKTTIDGKRVPSN